MTTSFRLHPASVSSPVRPVANLGSGERPNRLTELVPELHGLVEVLHVASFDSMVLYSDIASQQVIIC